MYEILEWGTLALIPLFMIGDLVIRDLLVKDYPILLRLGSIRRVYLPIVQKEYAP